MNEEIKRMGSAKNAENLSQEDVFLRQSKSDDELKEMNWKQCTSCNEMRPPKLFYKGKRRDGMSYTCKLCHRKKVRSYRNVEGSYNFFYRRLEKMRNKARKRGLEFTLTVAEYERLKENTICFYCKDEMEVVTIDRVDNDKGYTIDNVAPCCFMCNKLKNNINFNLDEMVIIGKAIFKFNKRMRKLAENEVISNDIVTS